MSDELDPFLQRLGDELERAVESAIQRKGPRRLRMPRRRFLRLALLGFAATALLSGSALAAGSMLGVIELGNGVRAEQVASALVWHWYGLGRGFVSIGGSRDYVYHVVGGSAPELSCGPSDPFPTNDIYVRSSRPLSERELKSLLAGELARERVSGATLQREVRAELRARRHGRRLHQTSVRGTPLPPGVLSVSNGCPPPSAELTPLSPSAGAILPVLAIDVTLRRLRSRRSP